MVFNRIPEAIVQHPLGYQSRRPQHAPPCRLAGAQRRRLEQQHRARLSARAFPGDCQVLRNPAGCAPRHAQYRNGGALAAAQFGVDAFQQSWLYLAAAGVAVTFVLNLGVSFSIASIVALRAYSVPRSEQIQIFTFIFKEFVRSPRDFIFPRRTDSLEPIIGATDETAEPSGAAAIALNRSREKEPEMTTALLKPRTPKLAVTLSSSYRTVPHPSCSRRKRSRREVRRCCRGWRSRNLPTHSGRSPALGPGSADDDTRAVDPCACGNKFVVVSGNFKADQCSALRSQSFAVIEPDAHVCALGYGLAKERAGVFDVFAIGDVARGQGEPVTDGLLVWRMDIVGLRRHRG